MSKKLWWSKILRFLISNEIGENNCSIRFLIYFFEFYCVCNIMVLCMLYCGVVYEILWYCVGNIMVLCMYM